jgi:hypothetical protein
VEGGRKAKPLTRQHQQNLRSIVIVRTLDLCELEAADAVTGQVSGERP